VPRRQLNDRFCQGARVAEGEVQKDFFDKDCTGLALRIFRSGAKSWMYRFSWGGTRKWMTLGTYPATGLAVARTRADEARHAIEAGKDPRASATRTLNEVLDEFVKRYVSGLRSAKPIEAALRTHVRPRLGPMSIYDLRRRDIVDMLNAVADKAGPVQADRTLAYLRKALNWYSVSDEDFRMPIVQGMSRTKPRERARARILNDDELRIVWRTAAEQGAFGRFVKFLLLTGARRNEAARMVWAELDGRDWTLPAARNKTKVDLCRPLSAAALALLGSPSPGLVFASDRGAMFHFVRRKIEFDRATGPIPNWTLHDLRRTARSLMSRAGVPTDHAERCLGHVIGGVRAVYDRHAYRDEKARAYEALAALIDRIINPQPNVVPLRAAE
jgi:integrase